MYKKTDKGEWRGRGNPWNTVLERQEKKKREGGAERFLYMQDRIMLYILSITLHENITQIIIDHLTPWYLLCEQKISINTNFPRFPKIMFSLNLASGSAKEPRMTTSSVRFLEVEVSFPAWGSSKRVESGFRMTPEMLRPWRFCSLHTYDYGTIGWLDFPIKPQLMIRRLHVFGFTPAN